MSQCIEGSHEFEMLVERDAVCVYRATCGCLRLQIGDVDMRVSSEEFEQLVSAITEIAGRTDIAEPLGSTSIQ